MAEKNSIPFSLIDAALAGISQVGPSFETEFKNSGRQSVCAIDGGWRWTAGGVDKMTEPVGSVILTIPEEASS